MTEEETFLYLSTTGHITGKTHRIEIWFVEYLGGHYILAEHFERTHWVQNIRKLPDVQFSLGTRSDNRQSQPATGRVIDDADEPNLSAAVKQLMAEKYGWSNGLIVELKPTVSDHHS